MPSDYVVIPSLISPATPEELQYEVELSDFDEPDATILSNAMAKHGQQVEHTIGDHLVRMKCTSRALRLLLKIHEDGVLACNMVYRRIPLTC